VLRTVIFACCLLFSSLMAGDEGLSYLNTLRQNAGLIPLTPNRELAKAAKAHARYLVRQQQNGHYEKKGRSGYSGRTPSDRVLKAGYASRVVMENISVNTQTAKESVDALMAAIYHRFVFLNFDRDEIGIGRSVTKRKRRITSAYVYDIGSSAVRGLCGKYYSRQNGSFYMENICGNDFSVIPQTLFYEKQNEIRMKNRRIILFPYENAVNVPPVFYTENPHPLPGSKVSGYPVSVQFNPVAYSEVRLKTFKLFDADGKEVKKTKILTYGSDRHGRFTKLQFALMPLKRLEFASTYSVVFEAVADGKKIKKRWQFTTLKPEGKYVKITRKKTQLARGGHKKFVFYFEPRNRKDVLGKVWVSGRMKVRYLDRNTLEVTLAGRPPSRGYRLKVSGREVVLK
jgi:hypothetical protein